MAIIINGLNVISGGLKISFVHSHNVEVFACTIRFPL